MRASDSCSIVARRLLRASSVLSKEERRCSIVPTSHVSSDRRRDRSSAIDASKAKDQLSCSSIVSSIALTRSDNPFCKRISALPIDCFASSKRKNGEVLVLLWGMPASASAASAFEGDGQQRTSFGFEFRNHSSDVARRSAISPSRK